MCDLEKGVEHGRGLAGAAAPGNHGAKRFGCASPRITAKSQRQIGPFGDRGPSAGEQQARARRAGPYLWLFSAWIDVP